MRAVYAVLACLLIFGHLGETFFFPPASNPCEAPKGINCLNRTTFAFRFSELGEQNPKLSPAVNCPQEYVCSENFLFPCIKEVPTTPPSTSTEAPEQPPECPEGGFHPSRKCNQYYECVRDGWWWWFKPELRTCPAGQAFNGKDGCEASSTCKP